MRSKIMMVLIIISLLTELDAWAKSTLCQFALNALVAWLKGILNYCLWLANEKAFCYH